MDGDAEMLNALARNYDTNFVLHVGRPELQPPAEEARPSPAASTSGFRSLETGVVGAVPSKRLELRG